MLHANFLSNFNSSGKSSSWDFVAKPFLGIDHTTEKVLDTPSFL